MLSTIKEETLTVEVNSNFKCKEEIDDEGPSETFNKFLTENQQNIEKFPEKCEVDEIDISETILQSSHYNFTIGKEIDSENQKAFTQRNSPDDDHKEKKCRSTMRSNSILGTKAKTKNCQFCNIFFTKKMYLNDHLLKHHKQEIKGDLNSLTNKIYTCNICDFYETMSKSRLDQHINMVHNKVNFQMKCQFCTKSFRSKQSLDGHVLRQHKDDIKNDIKSFITSKIHICKICNSYETTCKSHLHQHINSVHNEARVKMKCQFCTESFTVKTSLHGHVLRKHKDKIKNNVKSFITSKIHVCKICNTYETTNKSNLDWHITSAHNKVKLKCQFCTETFTAKRSLDEHVLRRHGDMIKNNVKSFITSKIHLCKICNSYETTRKSHLYQHINSVHNEARVKLKCQFCTKSFTAKPSLDEHVLRKHKDNIKKNFKSFITSKIHTCKICNSYETTHKTSLDKHINSVHNEAKGKMKCQFCTKSFIFKQSLDGHVLNKHKDKIKNNVKSFITSKIHLCTICNSYETTQKSNLDWHITSAHNEVKTKMKCLFCLDLFLSKISLRKHILKKHKNKIKDDIKTDITNKIHSCQICSFECMTKHKLTKHVNLVHNKKMKWKCEFCHELFKFKHTLNNHLLKQHKSEIEDKNKANLESNCHLTDKSIVKVEKLHQNEERKKEIYICDICAYQTKRKHLLINHFNSVHNRWNNKDFITKNIYSCKICSYQTTNTAIMETHILSNHNNLRIIIQRMNIRCHFCTEVFPTNTLLKEHMLKEHHKETVLFFS